MSESPRTPRQEKDPTIEHPGTRACESLEEAITEYEHYMLLAEAYVYYFTGTYPFHFNPVLRNDSSLKHWDGFREYLLGIDIARLKRDPEYTRTLMKEVQKFVPTEELIQFDRKTQGNSHQKIPEEAIGTTADSIDSFLLLQTALWTASSRRVISLSQKTVSSFADANEDYPMSWDDVLMPHDSFMIEVPNGCLQVDIRGVQHQLKSILISSIDDGRSISIVIRPFWEETLSREERVDFDSELLRSAERAKRKRWSSESVKDFFAVAERADMKDKPITRVRKQGHAFKCRIEDVVDAESDTRETRIIKRLIAGTCLYMASAREGTEEPGRAQSQPVSEKNRKVHPRRPTIANVVTDKAQVLSLHRVVSFSPTRNHLAYEAGDGSILTAHVVRKHYRRRPNTPPDAPKDIKVASYWKGLDSLPKNALPGGVVTKL